MSGGEGAGDEGHGRRLIVWRHGQTTHNAAGIWQGHVDAPLSELGRQQAADAAKILATYGASRIVASDLSRAADTGRALADVAGIPITYDARLREINVGQWAGQTTEQIRAEHGDLLDQVAAGEDIRRGHTGETVAELAQRAEAAAHEVISQMADGETVVLACHGVTSRAVCAALVGIPQTMAWVSLRSMSNAHWAVLTEQRGQWRLAGWNIRS